MTRDQFIYALTACGCLLKDGKTWYEHNELIKCFENLGLFEQETKNCSDCEIVQACVEAGIRSTSRALDILDKIRAEIKAKIEEEEFARSVFRHEEKDAVKAEQCTGSIMAYSNLIKLIDKYKAESEEQMEKQIDNIIRIFELIVMFFCGILLGVCI